MSAARTFLRSYVGSSLFFGVLIGLTVCYLTFERRPRELCYPAAGLDAGAFADVIRICDVRVDALAHLFFASFAVVSGSLIGPIGLALGGIAAAAYLWRGQDGTARATLCDQDVSPKSSASPGQAPRNSFEKGRWRAKRFYFIVSGFILSASLTWSVAATYAALQLNPQGAFCDYGTFDGSGLSAWLGLECNPRWLKLALFPVLSGTLGSVPLLLYVCFLSVAKIRRWLIQRFASGPC